MIHTQHLVLLHWQLWLLDALLRACVQAAAGVCAGVPLAVCVAWSRPPACLLDLTWGNALCLSHKPLCSESKADRLRPRATQICSNKRCTLSQAKAPWLRLPSMLHHACINACCLVLHHMSSVLLQEIRRIWVGYWSQADAQLGQRLAAKLQAAGVL